MIVNYLMIFLVLILLPLTGVAYQQQDIQEPLAMVNDEIITMEDFELYWNMIPDNYKIQLNKEDLLEQIIMQTLLVQKADEIDLREDPEIAFQIKSTTEQILIQFLLEREIIEKIILTDEDIETYYEENKENYWQEEEVHALNILVETREEAEEIMQKLMEGQEFAELAREFSIASSAPAGGDIGLIQKGTLISEIEDQLFTLDSGEISEIVSTERGFHIFKIIEKNPAGYLEFSEVKMAIEDQLLPLRQQEAFDQYLKDIEELAVIEKNVELLAEKEDEILEEEVEETEAVEEEVQIQ